MFLLSIFKNRIIFSYTHYVIRGGSRGAHPARAPLKLEKIWFCTRNTQNIFTPPSARRNFFKCAPLTWNPGSAPGHYKHMSSIGVAWIMNYKDWTLFFVFGFYQCEKWTDALNKSLKDKFVSASVHFTHR